MRPGGGGVRGGPAWGVPAMAVLTGTMTEASASARPTAIAASRLSAAAGMLIVLLLGIGGPPTAVHRGLFRAARPARRPARPHASGEARPKRPPAGSTGVLGGGNWVSPAGSGLRTHGWPDARRIGRPRPRGGPVTGPVQESSFGRQVRGGACVRVHPRGPGHPVLRPAGPVDAARTPLSANGADNGPLRCRPGTGSRASAVRSPDNVPSFLPRVNEMNEIRSRSPLPVAEPRLHTGTSYTGTRHPEARLRLRNTLFSFLTHENWGDRLPSCPAGPGTGPAPGARREGSTMIFLALVVPRFRRHGRRHAPHRVRWRPTGQTSP